MFLQNATIDRNSFVSDIVKQDHHTADVFRKYGIDYCCGGRWPMETACLIKGVEFEVIKKELEDCSRVSQLPPALPFDDWDIDFLTSYIINIHHHYLKKSLSVTAELVKHFADGHVKKYPHMQEVYSLVGNMAEEILPHLQMEEETIFPYICQVAHAYANRDPYAKLFVKTLRKPLGTMMEHEHHKLVAPFIKIRELTNRYEVPVQACVSHKVALSRLRELDNDLMQHIFLENEILFPRAIRMEKELMG